MQTITIQLWDGFVRGFHWLLVLVFAGLWYTGGNIDYIDQHHQLGLVMLALVLTRMIWGFIGSRSARFTTFIKSPFAVFRYARAPLQKDYLTHNPAGAYMVVIMLALLLAQAISGLFTDDAIFFRGPLAQYVSNDTVRALTRYHKQAFDYILIVIALHLMAVAVYTLLKKKLIKPMMTGKKDVSVDDTTASASATPASRHGGWGFLLLAVNLAWIFYFLS